MAAFFESDFNEVLECINLPKFGEHLLKAETQVSILILECGVRIDSNFEPSYTLKITFDYYYKFRRTQLEKSISIKQRRLPVWIFTNRQSTHIVFSQSFKGLSIN
jgi:hypothetical protein